MKKTLLASLLVAVVGMGAAHASIIGDTVNVTHYYENLSTVNNDLGSQVVPTAAFNYYGIYDLVVYGDYLTLNVYCGTGCSWNAADFNGAVLTDLSSSLFTGASIDASSSYAGFDTSRLSFDADHIYINLEGLTANGYLRVDFSSNDAPEPGTMALAGLALAGLGLARRRKN